MGSLLPVIQKLLDIVLILIGFGLVVFIHELGHFVAAKWAGVRVQAFAIGFGNAIVSYRKGFGLRRGSSEKAYNEYLVRKADGAVAPDQEVSPTEYRLNTLPLGGYVKMLGQDDAHPDYRSDEPDSYTSVPNWKRMIIISAGVTMNVIAAAILYVIVFTVGLKTEPPVIGAVAEGSPAAQATLVGASADDTTQIGLRPGDVVTSINGDHAASFNDIILGVAMAKGEEELEIAVEREGAEGPLRYRMVPVQSDLGLQQIGVENAITAQLREPATDAEAETFEIAYRQVGLAGIPYGSRLTHIDGEPVRQAGEIQRAANRARGEPINLRFEHEGEVMDLTLPTTPVLEFDPVTVAGETRPLEHIAGLTPVMQVGPESPVSSNAGYEQGLREGDIFARLGAVNYPSMPRGVAEVGARAGDEIEAVVLRQTNEGTRFIDLTLKVIRDGRVGFSIANAHEHTYLAAPPSLDRPLPTDDAQYRPGSRIVSVAGTDVRTFADIVRILQRTLVPGEASVVEITLEPPLRAENDEPETQVLELAVTAEQTTEIAALKWSVYLPTILFEPEVTTLKAGGPIEAIGMGLHETKRVMMNTYLTFVRLYQGSVSPKNLNGPVGIVHIGTVVVSRGFIWLLFFFALVNINLAVINFLPIPITDGGHMLFLLWEQITGRPVSVAVQNAATLAGLLLIVAVFLFVTYNDISRLIGS